MGEAGVFARRFPGAIRLTRNGEAKQRGTLRKFIKLSTETAHTYFDLVNENGADNSKGSAAWCIEHNLI
jgi:hypothetical protein